MSDATALPDLLRRFVATPYRFGAAIYAKVIDFETNDQELLSSFRAQSEALVKILTALSSQDVWRCKLVRDHDIVQEDCEAHLVSDEALSTLFVGTGTVVAIDWGRGEILGFLAANLPATQALDILLELAESDKSVLRRP